MDGASHFHSELMPLCIISLYVLHEDDTARPLAPLKICIKTIMPSFFVPRDTAGSQEFADFIKKLSNATCCLPLPAETFRLE